MRVVVALSGGVDSAVSALLLQQAGYDVHALFMKNWEEDDRQGYCAAAADLRDAEQICERLGLPLHTVNLSSEYWEAVFTPALESFREGRTPNPDVLCNREIKFRAFLDHALSLGAIHIATGHYARILRNAGGYHLLKGLDGDKDQSYFLYRLDQSQLSRTLFPLGRLNKHTVRRIAFEARLPIHDKKDSTGICFIGERPFKAFLSRYLTGRPGDIETVEGKRVGTHDGLAYYTVGQRRGVGIGGQRGGTGNPWYVVAKDLERNTLIVAQGRTHPSLYAHSLLAEEVHWIADPPPRIPLRCHAKTRYRQSDQRCQITFCAGERYRVRFDEAQWALTPGQSIVFYQGEECLGGGTICTIVP